MMLAAARGVDQGVAKAAADTRTATSGDRQVVGEAVPTATARGNPQVLAARGVNQEVAIASAGGARVAASGGRQVAVGAAARGSPQVVAAIRATSKGRRSEQCRNACPCRVLVVRAAAADDEKRWRSACQRRSCGVACWTPVSGKHVNLIVCMAWWPQWVPVSGLLYVSSVSRVVCLVLPSAPTNPDIRRFCVVQYFVCMCCILRWCVGLVVGR